MFGEVGLYCDQVFFAVICDDQLFIKITPEVAARMPDCPKAPAYPGAKESFLMEDLDDREDWHRSSERPVTLCPSQRRGGRKPQNPNDV